jgi:hypothetical protein
MLSKLTVATELLSRLSLGLINKMEKFCHRLTIPPPLETVVSDGDGNSAFWRQE